MTNMFSCIFTLCPKVWFLLCAWANKGNTAQLFSLYKMLQRTGGYISWFWPQSSSLRCECRAFSHVVLTWHFGESRLLIGLRALCSRNSLKMSVWFQKWADHLRLEFLSLLMSLFFSPLKRNAVQTNIFQKIVRMNGEFFIIRLKWKPINL